MTASTNHSSAAPQSPAPPWWRVGFVWLVVGGPLAVVVASLVTAAIAVSGAEEVLTESSPRASGQDSSSVPAVQARNHAATPRR
ncbi:MAG: nitrogen fixation protein FixH [Rubrivivax sp.]